MFIRGDTKHAGIFQEIMFCVPTKHVGYLLEIFLKIHVSKDKTFWNDSVCLWGHKTCCNDSCLFVGIVTKHVKRTRVGL